MNFGQRSMALGFLALGLWLGATFRDAAPAHAHVSSKDEVVYFNVETLKFHCLECQWARRCTRNCIELRRSEALKRGGVACKVCGGTCRRELKAPSAGWPAKGAFLRPMVSANAVWDRGGQPARDRTPRMRTGKTVSGS